MTDRLLDYKNKCKVLKQIQSNKALFYRRVNSIQNFITVFVSGFITFIGFSGFEQIQSYIQLLFKNHEIKTETIQMGYNFSVFILFIIVIFHMVFRFNDKQAEAEKAISLLSGLINEIDDVLEGTQPYYAVSSITDKYLLIIQMVPSNTDKEYLKAKKSLDEKTKAVRVVEKHSLFTLSTQEQEKYIIKLVKRNHTVQGILKTLQKIDKELYLGGGVIRNIVWDDLHNYHEMTPIDDIDVIYFDDQNKTKDHDLAIEKKLKAAMPNFKWSVKNQARMNTINNDEPYSSLYEAISKWPETASAMLIREDVDGKYIVLAPFGFDDLFRLIVQPTPHFMGKINRYRQRILEHNWQEKWSKLKILYIDQFDDKSSKNEQL